MNTKLFVGGLSWGTTDDTLAAHFAQAGTVVSAKVITDKYSGRSKGYGFVEMSNEDEAGKAVTMFNGQMFDGRTINVSEARPQANSDEETKTSEEVKEVPADTTEEVQKTEEEVTPQE